MAEKAIANSIYKAGLETTSDSLLPASGGQNAIVAYFSWFVSTWR